MSKDTNTNEENTVQHHQVAPEFSDLVAKVAALTAQLEKHEQTLENFRTSFKNFDLLITNLKERNRLR